MKKVTFCKSLKTSLSGKFIYNLQTFRGLCQVHFTILSRILHEIIFYLPVNTDKPKIVGFLVFVCKTALSIAQISSSENASKRDAILAPVVKQ